MTPEEENQSVQEDSKKKASSQALIRGADGALYLINEDELAPYKLDPEETHLVAKAIEAGHEDLVVVRLPRAIVEWLEAQGRGPSVSSDTYFNDLRRE